jgi:ABC-type phosphate transport system ATPase subunit
MEGMIMNKLIIDKDSIYSYKGYNIYRTRNKNGDLRRKIVIIKDRKTMFVNTIGLNETISNTVHKIKNKIDKLEE